MHKELAKFYYDCYLLQHSQAAYTAEVLRGVERTPEQIEARELERKAAFEFMERRRQLLIKFNKENAKDEKQELSLSNNLGSTVALTPLAINSEEKIS